jgi:hypothetical protein
MIVRNRLAGIAAAAVLTGGLSAALPAPVAAAATRDCAGRTAACAEPSPAPPAARAGSPETRAFIKMAGARAIGNQDALSVFRSWIISRPGFRRSGWVGSIDDLAHKAMTVMWHGPRTPLLAAIIRQGERRGIAVSVQPRQHSLEQIDAAVSAIWREAAHGGWAGFRISAIATVGARDDGLTVNGTYTSIPAARRASQVKSLATVVMGMPVRVVPGVSVVPATGRDDDFAPFFAGGYMMDQNGTDTCSSGFAIWYSGATHITTARHCNASAYRPIDTFNSYGHSVATSSDGGGRVLSATGAALAWDGPYNSQDFSKLVIGYEDLGVGDYVCTGGGNSGEHCNIKVTNMRVWYNDGFGAFSTIEGVQQSSGAIAAIEGDSGGPVISLTSTQSGEVRAAGMMQAEMAPVMTGSACGPAWTPGRCSKTVLFSSMRTIVDHIPGASLLAG